MRRMPYRSYRPRKPRSFRAELWRQLRFRREIRRQSSGLLLAAAMLGLVVYHTMLIR